MWVDIANLIGPRGEPGQDGDPGPQGPINVGLRPEEQITYDPAGGFTFHFVDDTSQTVNLPMASAQSAGLLSAAGARQLSWSGAVGVEALWPGTYSLYRFGQIVILTGSNVRPQSTGTATVLHLPPGYRPASTVQSAAIEDGALRSIFARSYSPFRVEVRGVGLINSWMDFTIVLPTNDLPPAT